MTQKPPRQFSLKDGAHRTVRDRPINRTFGPAGEDRSPQPVWGTGEQINDDRAEFDATAEWLRHVEAGQIGSR
ncbi:MAG TPA: hypothetical protein VMN38_10370 [Sphingomicrobium sp.]|nr:hypothetical protein [Sphingomicrobium sp.]